MSAVNGARPGLRRLGAAIAALLVLFVLATSLLSGQAISAFGLLLVSGVVLCVGLLVLPGAEARPGGRGRPLLQRVALGMLGLVAAAAFLASGLLLLLTFALSPNPGNDAPVLVLKTADFVGWLAIGLWLLLDWRQLRLRVVVPPVAAWLWAYLLVGAMSGLAYLPWGP